MMSAREQEEQNGKSTTNPPHQDSASADNAQLIRKLYRTSLECVKCLDKSTKDRRPERNIFTPEVVAARNRLRECCEKLMFLNPLDFGRKAEDMIWKKCFYEPIQICRQNKEKLSEEQKSLTCLLLCAATGYYHSLLIKIQKEVQMSLRSSFPRTALSWKRGEEPRGRKKELNEWAVHSSHKSLIYLGDIARYQVDFQGEKDKDEMGGNVSLAEYYYSEAITVRPFHGMPLNQLGTLYGMRNWGVDAVFFYMRCLYSEENFEGVKGNLAQVFSRNDKIYESLSKEEQSIDKQKTMKTFLIKFLHLMGALFENRKDIYLGKRLELLRQEVLEALDKSLPLVEGDETGMDPVGLSHMDPNLLLKILVIMMMVIQKLQSEESSKLSAGIALFLSSFAQILDHLIVELGSWPVLALVDEGSPNPEESMGNEMQNMAIKDSNDKVTETKETEWIEERDQSTSPPPVTRRRRADDSSDEEGPERSQSDEEDVIELADESEDEEKLGLNDSSEKDWAKMVERAMSPLDSGCQSGETPPGDHPNGVFPAPHNHQTQEEERRLPFSELEFADQYESLSGMGFLMVVKVVCDWFRSNPSLIVSMEETSKMLWGRMCTILNLLPHEETVLKAVSKDSQLKRMLVGEIWCPLSEWSQKLPLPEDVFLRGTPSLSALHSQLHYSSGRNTVDKNVECLVRLFSIRSFGNYLVERKTPDFHYDSNEKKFLSPKSNTAPAHTKEASHDRQGHLMKNMAKLRAQDELAEFNRIGWIPVYLVPEMSVLLSKLTVVKQLAGAQRFVSVLPQESLKTLEDMKKDSSDAREAIRFLETCFRQGNKYVRAQKAMETAESIQLEKGTSKEVSSILKCCGHLCGKVKGGAGSVVVTIITAHKPASEEFGKLEEAVKSTGLQGMNVEFVHKFWSRWQGYRKKGG